MAFVTAATCTILEAVHSKVSSLMWVFSTKENDGSAGDLTTIPLPVVYCKTYPTEGLAGTAETPSCCTGRGSTARFKRMWLAGWPRRVTWRHAFPTRECWGAWHTLRKTSNIHRSAEKFKWCVVSYVVSHWEVIFGIFVKFSDFT